MVGRLRYYHPWVDPWKVLGWGLEAAGLKSGRWRMGRFRRGRWWCLRMLRCELSPLIANCSQVTILILVLGSTQETAQSVLRGVSKRPNNADRIFSTEMFLQEFPIHRKQLSETDLKVLLVFLSRDLREAFVANNVTPFPPTSIN